MYGTRTIRDDDGALVYLLDRRPPKRLISLGGALFTLEGAPYTRIELERDANGAVAALVIREVYGAVARYPRSPK